MVPALICGFCKQKRDFRTRITSLYGSQTSPMVFCIQNRDFSTGIASLYRSQPLSAVLSFKTGTFAPKLQVSIGPSPYLLHFWKNCDFWIKPLSAVFSFKTGTFARELQISIGPSPYLPFLHPKQRLLDQNYKSLWVPDFACWFLNA